MTSTNDDHEITSIRAEKLAQAAKGNVDALSRWAEQHSTGDTPPSKKAEKDLYYRAKNCLKLLSEYGKLGSESAKVRHLMYLPLGFHLLSMNAFNLSDPKFKSGYKTEIEMDIAGTTFYVLDLYIKNCAELKLSERAKAIDQVMVRLAIFWVSSTVLLSEEDHHIIAKFHGDVYSCLNNWAPITREDIKASILRCSLKIPPGVVTLAVKRN